MGTTPSASQFINGYSRKFGNMITPVPMATILFDYATGFFNKRVISYLASRHVKVKPHPMPISPYEF